MSCLTQMMLLPIVSPNGDRVVDHRLLLGVASSSDRLWLHRVRGATEWHTSLRGNPQGLPWPVGVVPASQHRPVLTVVDKGGY